MEILSSETTFPKKKKNTRFLWMLAPLLTLTVLLGGVGLAFVPVNSRTLASRGLDSLGLHKEALVVDYAANEGDVTTLTSLVPMAFAQTESKQDSCEQALWAAAQTNMLSLDEVESDYQSARYGFQMYPLADEYRDTLYFDGATEFILNEETIQTRLDWKVGIDGDIVADSFEEYNELSNEEVKLFQDALQPFLGAQSIQVVGDVIVKNVENNIHVYTSLDNLSYASGDEVFDGGLSSSYFTSTEQFEDVDASFSFDNDEDDDAYNAFLELFEDTNISDIVSDDTGLALGSYLCAGVDEIEVSNIQEQDGRTYRDITVTFRDDALDRWTEVDNIKPFFEELANDETLESFLKDNYEEFKEIAEIQEDDTFPATREEYEAQINESFDELKAEFEDEDKLNELQDQLDELKSENIKFADLEYAYDVNEKEVFEISAGLAVVPTEEEVEGMESETLKKVLKDGVEIRFSADNIKSGDDVERIEIPSALSVKDAEDILTDALELNAISELEARITQVQQDLLSITFPEEESSESLLFEEV